MGRKAIGWKNLWSLTVLVFLRLKPMHPYELQSVIKLTHKDAFLPLKPGSLYNSINRLLKAGLIEVAKTTRAGRRPERTVYRITRVGTRETLTWLGDLLERPGPDATWFFAALSFLPVLHPPQVAERLETRARHLESEVRQHQEVLSQMLPKIGRLPLIEVEYALAMRKAERDWVAQLAKELRAGKLDWNPEIVRQHAAQWLCASPGAERQA
jgi:DNA-binding PadR family transcriptional regulator